LFINPYNGKKRQENASRRCWGWIKRWQEKKAYAYCPAKSGGVQKNRSQRKFISTSSGVWRWAIYKNAPVSQTLTDSEIIDAVLGHRLNESEDSDDSNGSVDEENKMTMAEAISCCDNLINFME
jgi:hypothetical protein